MRAAIYARVSTQRQQQHQTIDSQLTALEAWVRQHGHDLLAPHHIFKDEGYSGSRLDRPGLDALRDAAHDGKFDLVIVLCPDRLARKYAYQVILLEELRRAGCEVVFLQHPISEDPNDQLLLQIQGAIAEYERAVLGERFRRGKLQKARAGYYLAGKAPYGYRYIPKRDDAPGHLVVDEAEAEVVRLVYGWLIEERMTVRQLLKRLNFGIYYPRSGRRPWSNSVVHHILADPVYTGIAYANRYRPVPPKKPRGRGPRTAENSCRQLRPREEWIAIPVPPIITPETFDLAAAQLARNSALSYRHNTKYTYLLRCLLTCEACGLSMFGITRQASARQPVRAYYACRGKDCVMSARPRACPRRPVKAAEIEGAVWEHITQLLADPEQLLTQFREMAQLTTAGQSQQQATEHKLAASLRRVAREEQRLVDAYQAEVITLEELAARRRLLTDRRQALTRQREQQIKLRQETVIAQKTFADLSAFCERVRARLDEATFAEKQTILQMLIERIIVGADTLEIRHVIPLRGSTADEGGSSTPEGRLRSDGVHQTELHLRLGIDCLDGFREAFQAIHAGYENIFDAPVLQLRDDREPELRAFIF
jgi:site-specific DNA recombinase